MNLMNSECFHKLSETWVIFTNTINKFIFIDGKSKVSK